MIRKFEFEAEIYKSLNCLPMAARRKLDALGIKVHLEQWEQFGRGERLMICHAPADTEEERTALRTFIEEVAVSRTGSPAQVLPEEVRQSAYPPAHPPLMLVQNARASGVELNAEAWAQLDDDQQYALIKLGDTTKPSHNLKPALLEFFSKDSQQQSSSQSRMALD
jgi:hypothetical protein